MSKEWAGKTIIGLAIYMVFLVLILTYSSQIVNTFGFKTSGKITSEVDLDRAFNSEKSCDYPRYKYDTNGESSKYVFDLDNLDCEVSAGAISEKTCNYFEGCNWNNQTSGFLWFTSVEGVCEGTINKTYYNNGTETSEKLCEINGIQGNENALTCSQLGCTVYVPKDNPTGVTSVADTLSTLSELFKFKYDFGLDNSLYTFLLNLVVFYLPLLTLIICTYLLSPFSN